MKGGFRKETMQMNNKPVKMFDLTSQRIQIKMKYSFYFSNWKFNLT